MSRARRPLRRVRGRELEQLVAAVWCRAGWTPLQLRLPEMPRGLLRALAGRWGWRCRPSHLRRCLLGLPVSARAAKRILMAAMGGRGGGL